MEQYIWEADTGNSFTVAVDTERQHGSLDHGTKVICYLKEDQCELLEEQRLWRWIHQFSWHISFPLKLGEARADDEEYAWDYEDPEASADQLEFEEDQREAWQQFVDYHEGLLSDTDLTEFYGEVDSLYLDWLQKHSRSYMEEGFEMEDFLFDYEGIDDI